MIPVQESPVQVSSDGKVVCLAQHPDNFYGGKIKDFISFWRQFSFDPLFHKFLLGDFLAFIEFPSNPCPPPNLRLSPSDQLALDKTILGFLDCNVVEPCLPTSGPCYYSPYFPVIKPDNTARFILNLKKLNPHVQYNHFKMDTMADMLDLMFENCFFVKIDLKNAYHSVPVRPVDRDWFRFTWRGCHFRFTCLPQGFSPAPRIFTKLLKPIFSHFRALGIITLHYLDDFIFLSDSAESLAKDVNYVLSTLDSLGLTINFDKSCLVPSQRIEFLGFILDSVLMSVTLTRSKQEKINRLGSLLLEKVSVTIRDLAVFIGNVVAASYGVRRAPLRFKYLEIFKIRALHSLRGRVPFPQVYDQLVTLDKRALGLITWWCNNIFHLTNPLSIPDIGLELVTDAASECGWGAYVGVSRTYGHWSAEEKELEHCNFLELKAILFGLQSLCHDIHNTHIRIRSDNSTAVACVNKCGSVKEALLGVTIEIFDWATSRNNHLSAAHIRGVDNEEADSLSRVANVDTEWSLFPSVFGRLASVFGSPKVDMFASRINSKLESYFSWHPDPSALITDAFTVCWADFYGYAFPPFRLLGRVLRKIIKDKATVLVVMPLWPTKPWFTLALSLLIATPRLISKGSLYLPQDPQCRHRLDHSLVLGALLLSGDLSLGRAFRARLPTFSLAPGVGVHSGNIGRISVDGVTFVTEGALVRFVPL